jgi:hypothetical protein
MVGKAVYMPIIERLPHSTARCRLAQSGEARRQAGALRSHFHFM